MHPPIVNFRTNDKELWKDCGLGNLPVALFDLNSNTADHLHQNPDNDWWIGMQRIQEVKNAEKIFVIGGEGLLPWKMQTLPDNVYCWDSVLGQQNPRFFPYMFWFDWAREITQDLGSASQLADLRSQTPQYKFECLLGRQRYHRDLFYHWLTESGLGNQGLISYFGLDQKWSTGSDIDVPGLRLAGPVDETLPEATDLCVDIDSIRTSEFLIKYQDEKTCLMSMLLPWKIYNDSWFSVISESEIDREYFTEKTAKALIGRRMFLILSAKHSLRSLREYGFKTFHDVIDESYDDIEDSQQRALAVFDQVKWLCKQPLDQIYRSVKPVLDHNHDLIMNINWRHQMIDQIREIAHSAQ